jgi:hypothetical protein
VCVYYGSSTTLLAYIYGRRHSDKGLPEQAVYSGS